MATLWTSELIEPLLDSVENFKDLVFILLNSIQVDQRARLVMGLWSIRHRRNNWLWNSHDDQDVGVLNRARVILVEWKSS